MNRNYLPYTLEQLVILRAIVNDGSFKNAARSLFLTQPAISLQIQNLEKQLKTTLFDRTKKQIELTESGNLLVRYSNRILALCEESSRALDDLSELKSGKLILGASQTTGTYLMPKIIGLFRQKYPILMCN
jgi:DNA-binding transcriptional LysR family regulator